MRKVLLCIVLIAVGYCQVWWMGIPSDSDPKRLIRL